MFLYNATTPIKPGKGWTDVNGVRHPKNWNIWSDDHKASMNITEVILDARPDGKFYNWIDKGLGGVSNITARNLDDTGSGNELVLGLKSKEKIKVKATQSSLLTQTDWAVIRKVDTDVDVPANIATWRAAIRTKATAIEDAIDAVADIEALIALLLSDTFNWPKLEE